MSQTSQIWYEREGWSSDPLDWRKQSSFIQGLELQQETLRQFIRRGKPIVLFGNTGSGKSTLAQHLSKNSDYHWVLVNGTKLGTQPKKIWKLVQEKVTSNVTGSDLPVVVMLDEALQAPKGTLRELQGLFDDGDIKSFLLIQMKKDLSKYSGPLVSRLTIANAFVETTQLSEQELFDMIDRRLDGKALTLFDEQALRTIIRFGQIPRLVLDLCSDVLDQVTGKVTLSDITQVVRQRGNIQPLTEYKQVTANVIQSDVASKSSSAKPTAEVMLNVIQSDELSPQQEEICAILSKGQHTRNELASKLVTTKISSLNSLLIKLQEKNKITKQGRPARYSLETSFNLQRLSDRR